MPSDAITLHVLCKELNTFLIKGKIEKIYQPEKDELTFLIKNNGKVQHLVISANAVYPRIHITKQKKENPIVASTFCMLLRKHLSSGIITNISLMNFDRIIKLSIQSRNEMGDLINFYLIAELMGRYSNIILTKDDFTILDSIKRIHFDQSNTRPILPNLSYSCPEQNKIGINDQEKLHELFQSEIEYDDKFLLENISGLSKETAKEIIYRDNITPQKIIDLFYNIYDSEHYKPCIRIDKNSHAMDFYFSEYFSIKDSYKFCSTLNECIDEFYSQRDAETRKKADTQQISKLLKRLKNKTERRIQDNIDKLAECEKAEKYKQYGEMILSNMHAMKKGQPNLTCINYYTNQMESVPLDTLKTPNQNAQNYFKKYHKLKRAKEISGKQLDLLAEQKIYLDTIDSAINNSDTKQEYQEIYNELLELGNLKKPFNPKKVKKQKPSSPLHLEIDGYDIYIGKNNVQNNIVTFQIASSSDTWMHTKSFHGAHAIIKGNNIPDAVIEKIARIAAYYSEGRNASKLEVDYTLRKNVKRHFSGMIGMVTYTNYKTILAQPNNHVND